MQDAVLSALCQELHRDQGHAARTEDGP
jgi:hypothetical protein